MKAGSLVGRLSVLQQLLAGVLILAFAGTALFISSHALERQETEYLNNTATRMVQNLDQEWAEDHDLKTAALDLVNEDAPLGVRIDILDERGGTVASTGNSVARPSGDMRSVRRRTSAGASVVVSLSTRPRFHALKTLSLALALAALPVFVAASLLGRWVSRRALRPLSRMASEAEGVSPDGAVQLLGSPGDPSEIALLAASFDRLIVRLNEMIRAERHFTEDAAHELRTPLTVLTGEIEYALGDANLSARHRDGLQRALGQVRAMSELVEALLFLRRADSGRQGPLEELVPVNLADLARDTLRSLLSPSLDRGADVTVDADDEVLVAGHSVLLGAALRNLLGNAIKFTERGQPIRITVKSQDGLSRIVVEDGGSGVAPQDRDDVFNPFFRGAEARANKEGSGLGLPILRRVARAHGGDVVLSTSPLGGASFELRLPRWASRV